MASIKPFVALSRICLDESIRREPTIQTKARQESGTTAHITPLAGILVPHYIRNFLYLTSDQDCDNRYVIILRVITDAIPPL
jgi:hypothetical protein